MAPEAPRAGGLPAYITTLKEKGKTVASSFTSQKASATAASCAKATSGSSACSVAPCSLRAVMRLKDSLQKFSSEGYYCSPGLKHLNTEKLLEKQSSAQSLHLRTEKSISEISRHIYIKIIRFIGARLASGKHNAKEKLLSASRSAGLGKGHFSFEWHQLCLQG